MMEKDLQKEKAAGRGAGDRPAGRGTGDRPAGQEASDWSAGDKAPVELDEKDRAILRLLQDNAKITVREIAAQVHLSTTPVHERIRRLEDTGVIRQYATILDHSKVRKGLLAICYVSLKEHNKKSGARFIKTIHELPEIIECYIISGEFDFQLKVAVENMDAYYDFHVNKLGQVENIGRVQSTFVMGVVKQTHRLIE